VPKEEKSCLVRYFVTKVFKAAQYLLFALIIIALSPLLIALLALWTLRAIWLSLLVRVMWYPHGKYLVLAYSNSPNWQQYIENDILPKLDRHCRIVNWSERSKWRWWSKPLEVKVFQHWTGAQSLFSYQREYIPVAITFMPWWRPRVFRFWKAFKDFKHGKMNKLKDLEREIFKLLEAKIEDDRRKQSAS
jgi:hypothetical protein